MSTLLLQCVAPLQAWGTQSNFTVRDTGREPSKSGIIGLLCAALGRPRELPVDDLAALRMGVRVDREGAVLRDFHTAGQGAAEPYRGHLQADGWGISKGTIISNRYYLADALFLVGLAGDDALLRALHDALRDPRWMLFLGRKACVPGRPAYLPDGLRPEPLDDALRAYPWLGSDRRKHKELADAGHRPRLVLEEATGDDMRKDTPLSFQRGERRFAYRRLTQSFLADMPPYRPPFALPPEIAPPQVAPPEVTP